MTQSLSKEMFRQVRYLEWISRKLFLMIFKITNIKGKIGIGVLKPSKPFNQEKEKILDILDKIKIRGYDFSSDQLISSRKTLYLVARGDDDCSRSFIKIESLINFNGGRQEKALVHSYSNQDESKIVIG